jgi:hypothetical protein
MWLLLIKCGLYGFYNISYNLDPYYIYAVLYTTGYSCADVACVLGWWVLSPVLWCHSCFTNPEDGIERISRNVVSFLQYYASSLPKKATTSVPSWRKPQITGMLQFNIPCGFYLQQNFAHLAALNHLAHFTTCGREALRFPTKPSWVSVAGHI